MAAGGGAAARTSSAVTVPGMVSSAVVSDFLSAVIPEAEQHDGDVVLAAALVGRAHERLGRVVERSR